MKHHYLWRMLKQSIMAFALGVLFIAGTSAAPILVNGNFENTLVTNSGPPAGLGFDYHTGNGIAGWTIAPGDKQVLFTSLYNPVGEGNQAVQLESMGTFSQTFATNPGQTYALTFLLSSYTGSTGPVQVTVDSIVGNFVGFDTSYQQYSMSWVADDLLATLSFQNSGAHGRSYAQIDGVAVNAVPEPGSLALLGLGLAGVVATRRRKMT